MQRTGRLSVRNSLVSLALCLLVGLPALARDSDDERADGRRETEWRGGSQQDSGRTVNRKDTRGGHRVETRRDAYGQPRGTTPRDRSSEAPRDRRVESGRTASPARPDSGFRYSRQPRTEYEPLDRSRQAPRQSRDPRRYGDVRAPHDASRWPDTSRSPESAHPQPAGRGGGRERPASSPRLDSIGAARTVERATGGRVLSVDQVERGGRLDYRVKVLLREGRVKTMTVNGQTGSVGG